MSKFRIDLHTHSTASDGTLAPNELIQRAVAMRLDAVALTDHDETAGLRLAGQTAAAAGIDFIPGIELSVSWSHQTVHIVGLYIQPETPALQTGIAALRDFRDWRGEEIARRLEKKGIAGAYVGAQKFSKGNILSRTHFAQFLVEQGHAKDIRRVFKHFLVRGKPGYVPGEWATLEQAVEWITSSGGLAVVAHPARYKFSATRLRQLLAEFAELGGVGIEVVSGSHSRDDISHMAQLAEQFGLAASVGSDFHGPQNAYMELGRLPALPENCQPIWEHENWPGEHAGRCFGSPEA